MDNREKKEKLEILRDLIVKKTYSFKKSGIEGRIELKNRVIEKLGISSDSYVFGDGAVINYLNSINRGPEFLDKLPLTLKKAVEIYCCSGYKDINNDFLRKNVGLKRGTNETTSHVVNYDTFESVDFYREGIVDSLDTVINETKLEKGIILYRGCDVNQFKDLNISSSEELLLCIGDKFIEHGYTSTTAELSGRFINECPIIMIISVSPETHIANFYGSSLGLFEGELLIERNVEYSINDVEIVDGKVFVYTDVKVRELKKGVENIDDIKLTDNQENLELYKYDVEEFDLDLDLDYEFENVVSSGRGGR